VSGPLSILHLTHDGGEAGSTVSIALLARAQRAAGHRVVVACPPGRWLEDLVRGAGGAFAALRFQRVGEAARDIAELARAHGVDVINAHSSRDRAACRRLRLTGRLRPALVMTRRGMPMSTPVSAALSGFAADRTIAVSRAVARALARRGTPPWRISVVHNAVDLERMDRSVSDEERGGARAALGVEPGRPVVGVVARRKDQDQLLRALPGVTTPLTVCCVGVMPDPVLAALADAASPHRVVFRPFTRDVRPLYEWFDVVALPTRHEGLSQALLEAMALGKPVLATAAGGNTDLIADGETGLLVPPRDPRALGAALQRLVSDPGLRERLGTSARRHVRSSFTIASTLAGTDAVYRRAIARRGTS
jgi:glycosyltransferase involved in cell wall biosynthesis